MKRKASVKNSLAPEDVEELLTNWVKLNKDILDLPFSAVQQLLAAEAHGRRRYQVMQRLYGRFSKLRRDHEQQELFTFPFRLPWDTK